MGQFVEIATGVQLAGFVQVGHSASLETGAIVIPNVLVGRGSVVCAASVVIRDVPEFVRVAGVPAKVLSIPTTVLAESPLEFGRVQAG
ncbi:MAG TPA: hypothetical protein VHD36_05600 [Pirellulales bacterium]|nr:hypothetical protein [Pirellulales bacterium]